MLMLKAEDPAKHQYFSVVIVGKTDNIVLKAELYMRTTSQSF